MRGHNDLMGLSWDTTYQQHSDTVSAILFLSLSLVCYCSALCCWAYVAGKSSFLFHFAFFTHCYFSFTCCTCSNLFNPYTTMALKRLILRTLHAFHALGAFSRFFSGLGYGLAWRQLDDKKFVHIFVPVPDFLSECKHFDGKQLCGLCSSSFFEFEFLLLRYISSLLFFALPSLLNNCSVCFKESG